MTIDGIMPERVPEDPLEAQLAKSRVLERLSDTQSEAPSFGRFQILERVGQGAHGVVFAAYDARLDRRVALKLLRRDSDEARSRMQGEARALARLSHPNVVSVHDQGEVDGRVFIAMEFIEGETLEVWLEQARPRARVLEVLRSAGNGLAAAHRSGVVHRDVKPRNVMVDVEGRVRVTDFGIAGLTALGPSGADSSAPKLSAAATQTGVLVGTPAYMAPEQQAGGRADALSDQYAFCVTAWEALAGRHPFAAQDKGAGGIAFGSLDALREAKEAGPQGELPGDLPRAVARALRRGLSPQPSHRWPNMDALLRRLEPRGASARSWWIAVIGVGVLASSWAIRESNDVVDQRCSGARDHLRDVWDPPRRAAVRAAFLSVDGSYAPQALRRAEAALDAYANAWTTMQAEACAATTLRGEQSGELLDLRMGCLRKSAIALETLSSAFANADAGVVQNTDRGLDSLPALTRCADVEALRARLEPPDPREAAQVQIVRDLLTRAGAQVGVGKLAAAVQTIAEAKSTARSLVYGPVHTEVELVDGSLLSLMGEDQAAEQALRRALGSASRWQQVHEQAAAARQLIQVIGVDQARFAEALALREIALGLAEASGVDDQADTLHNIAGVLLAAGEPRQAEALLQQALTLIGGQAPPRLALEAHLRASLAAVLAAQGSLARAEAEVRRAITVQTQASGPEHASILTYRANLAAVLLERGRNAEAIPQLSEVLAQQRARLGNSHPQVLATQNNLSIALERTGQSAEAERGYREVLAAKQATLDANHPSIALAHNSLAVFLSRHEHYAEAATEHERALALQLDALGPEHPDVALSRFNLADVLLALDRPADALPLLESAWTRNQQEDIPAKRRAKTAFALAKALWDAGRATTDRRQRARRLATTSLQQFRDAGDEHATSASEVERWLATHP